MSAQPSSSSSSNSSLTQLLQELSHAHASAPPHVAGDVVQFAADWFQEKLRQERSSSRSGESSAATATGARGSSQPPPLPSRRGPQGAPGSLQFPSTQNHLVGGFHHDAGAHPSPFSEHGPSDGPFGGARRSTVADGNGGAAAPVAGVAAAPLGRGLMGGNTGTRASAPPSHGPGPFNMTGTDAGNANTANHPQSVDTRASAPAIAFGNFSFNGPSSNTNQSSQSQHPLRSVEDASPFDEANDSVGQLGGGHGMPPPAHSAGAAAAAGPDSELMVPAYALGRRTSVSAESLVPSSQGPRRSFAADVVSGQAHPSGVAGGHQDMETTPTANDLSRGAGGPAKSESQIARIRSSIGQNFLFRNLDDDQERDVLAAMNEVHVQSGEVVIQQGTAGDFFYVVESGEFDIYVQRGGDQQGAGAAAMATEVAAPPLAHVGSSAEDLEKRWGKKVVTVTAGGSFGELALMYNAPRAATVVAKGSATLWALDRISFRTILLDHTSRRRRMYESFLASVPILSSLQGHERAKIADALESKTYAPGEVVVSEGEQGDEFYLIENGVATVEKGGQAVGELSKGDYFGELALLNRAPRAATVRAAPADGVKLRVATLGEKAFTRLLGPVRDIMARSAGERYGYVN